jgi:hypothetical protein
MPSWNALLFGLELEKLATEGDGYYLRLLASQALYLYAVFGVFGVKFKTCCYHVADILSLHQYTVLKEWQMGQVRATPLLVVQAAHRDRITESVNTLLFVYQVSRALT